MLKLHGKFDVAGKRDADIGSGILKLTENTFNFQSDGDKLAFLCKGNSLPPSQFSIVVLVATTVPNDALEDKFPNTTFILLGDDFDYLQDGDVLKISIEAKRLRTLYRRSSKHNSFLLTERCNHYCVMCSQPPREIDDGYLTSEILEMIPLIDRGTREIGLTGGEPTLCGDQFFNIVAKAKRFLPETAVHILSNGRSFASFANCERLARIAHPDLMIGIPVYSDYAPLHNFVVQSQNAFSETIKGIVNLKSLSVKVEVRFVLNKYTADRIIQFAEFVERNLLFVDHVAFMGLETVGFARSNIDDLWIDPSAYMDKLAASLPKLAAAGLNVSLYNSQLCLVPKVLMPYYRHSISDWKNDFMSECEECMGRLNCAGFFSSNKLRHSTELRPYVKMEDLDAKLSSLQ